MCIYNASFTMELILSDSYICQGLLETTDVLLFRLSEFNLCYFGELLSNDSKVDPRFLALLTLWQQCLILLSAIAIHSTLKWDSRVQLYIITEYGLRGN